MSRIPYSCPVCGGRGTVPWYFYATTASGSCSCSSAADEQCRTCKGSGVVWDDTTASSCGCTVGTTQLLGGVTVHYHQCPHEDQPADLV